ncbi:MAG: hypothetical protein ED556_07270 [Winogradskyella sp.]|uniref:hypothetical protein n=1 Tax=Winogradskyella sp. TaxID=1883156 RepID=UPI000F40D477|nr:hypothetical protein [Winogradskyella sp.]RNC87214.1 MAG: hypothetical protein ED556_07270 [Winogradskyella sp.]
MKQLKRILKVFFGIIIFLTLPSLLFFGFLYIRYDKDLPSGTKGKMADELAINMLKSLNHDAYLSTDYIEWTFKGRQHYKWYKSADSCEVQWNDFKVMLHLKKPSLSSVYVAKQKYEGTDKQKLIGKAEAYFNNDSFWIAAPYKVFDKGTERRLVKTDKDEDALLVTYTSGGSTPGDSYLWHFDREGKPKSYQMWTDLLPIDGLEASWSDWKTTKSGAELPTFHKILFLNLEITNLKTN